MGRSVGFDHARAAAALVACLEAKAAGERAGMVTAEGGRATDDTVDYSAGNYSAGNYLTGNDLTGERPASQVRPIPEACLNIGIDLCKTPRCPNLGPGLLPGPDPDGPTECLRRTQGGGSGGRIRPGPSLCVIAWLTRFLSSVLHALRDSGLRRSVFGQFGCADQMPSG